MVMITGDHASGIVFFIENEQDCFFWIGGTSQKICFYDRSGPDRECVMVLREIWSWQNLDSKKTISLLFILNKEGFKK